GEMLDKEVGYLEITSFGNNLAESIKLYLDDMIEEGASRLIIDLRNNGGGYLKAIEEISPIFFDNNDVVYQEDHRQEENKIYNVSKSEKQNYPFEKIVILQNENSASASEVLTLAMRENLDTEVVGVTSYGKGTIQVQKRYPDKSVLKLTVAKWLSPSGQNIDQVGIKPDVEVKLADIFYEQFVELEEEIVKYDTVHDAVAYAQKALVYLTQHQGRTDGYFDKDTLVALNKFQVKYGYDKTDYIDKDIMVKLYSAVVSDWSMNKDERDIQLHKAIEVVKK
ncbi:MAG TPA: S41 family peptidase, partial [Erysipelothrix sp.]